MGVSVLISARGCFLVVCSFLSSYGVDLRYREDVTRFHARELLSCGQCVAKYCKNQNRIAWLYSVLMQRISEFGVALSPKQKLTPNCVA